jgi:hypothetical protein
MNNPWYRNRTWIAVAVLLILIVGGWMAFRGGNNGGDDRDDESSEVAEARSGEIKIVGTIACLPNSGTGEDCVKGIKGDDNKMYALNSLTQLKVGTKVTALGKFEPATSNAESGTFQYDGVLTARTIIPR